MEHGSMIADGRVGVVTGYSVDPYFAKRLEQERNSISGGMPDAPVCQSFSDAYQHASDRVDSIEKAAFGLELLADKFVGALPSDAGGACAPTDTTIVGAMYSHVDRLQRLASRIHRALERIEDGLGLPR